MSASKEIRTKIKSVQHTSKITRAMEMVAASKMRRVQEAMSRARPYAEHIRSMVIRLKRADTDYTHPYLVQDFVSKDSATGLILVSTDKGLCGGLNANLFRLTLDRLRALNKQKVSIQTTAIGAKGVGFLLRMGTQMVSQVTHLGDSPKLEQFIGSIRTQLDAYEQGKIQSVYLAYNRFLSAMQQKPVIEQLLPIPSDTLVEGSPLHSWEYIYEPSPSAVIDQLLVRYVESLVYQSIIENMACEQSARMLAMRSASDNAKSVVSSLRLSYNKARQAAITQELSEIVAGSAALML